MFDAITAKNINAWVGGILSPLTIVGTWIGYLPYVAATVAVIWYIIQIWESRTIQAWWTNRQLVRRSRKIARLKAAEKVITAKLSALQKVSLAKQDARESIAIAVVEAATLKARQETEIAAKLNNLIPLKE